MIMIKPRIIAAGSTGKTGSVVVTELLKAGYPVFGARVSSPIRFTALRLNNSIEFLGKQGIMAEKRIERLVRGNSKAFQHLAAELALC